MKLQEKPIIIKSMSVHNRIVLPPMATSKSEVGGQVSEAIKHYYDEKTKSGQLGLVIIEHSYIDPKGKASPNQMSISNDADIEPLKALAKLIQNNGSKVIMQINHAGSATTQEITGYDVIGPSATPNPRRGNVPTAMRLEDIQHVKEAFVKAAVRVKTAGFDGVEIHSAHGYLLNQFYSPLSNKREDEYGGDLMGRIKLHLEIIKEIRAAVGDEFPILLRLGASDYLPEGATIEDAVIACKAFEAVGVDVIDISGGFCGYMVPGRDFAGYFSDASEAVKNRVNIPVILTGGVVRKSEIEALLEDGKADMIGVGRAILNNSNWFEQE